MGASSAAADLVVLDEPERSRFEVRVEGELAGFAEYRRRRLVRTALDESRAAGLAVLPFCPFVRGYIVRHLAAYLDLVPESQRDAFELPAHA